MSDNGKPAVGTVGWIDLTVDDADAVRDFYRDVVGWDVEPVDMGGYSDYCMRPPGGDVVAGVCHQKKANAGLPRQWLIYITVHDLDASLAAVKRHGGKEVSTVRKSPGQGRFCVVQDPAGAVCALFEMERK